MHQGLETDCSIGRCDPYSRLLAPDCFISSVHWPGTNKIKARTTWETFHYRCNFEWGWADRQHTQYVKALVPPIPLTSSSSKCQWDALSKHPLLQPIMTFMRKMFELVTVSFCCIDFDNFSTFSKGYFFSTELALASFATRAGVVSWAIPMRAVEESSSAGVLGGSQTIVEGLCWS